MIVNNNVTDENKSKLKRVITEKTGPETNNNPGNEGYNNLNSVLQKVGKDRMVQYITIPKTETGKIEGITKKEITDKKDDDNNKDKINLKTNVKRNNSKNLDIYFVPKRVDRNNIPITKGGKQKVTFKNNFTEVIKVESFKEYNKMEEVSNSHKNNCCILV
jgi:hypothetical protein